jgi:hypothetical protein
MTIECVSFESNYKGMSYGEWAGTWWNWLLSEKPEYDQGPVLFTRGANGEDPTKNNIPTLEKTVSIPSGTAIFTGVCDSMFTLEYGDKDNRTVKTVNEMRALSKKEIDSVSEIGAILINTENGKKDKIVDNWEKYRIQSPIFRVFVPNNSLLKDKLDEPIEPGTYDAVTEGYYIFISPSALPPGNYQLQYYAKATEGDYKYKSVYNITVEQPKKGGAKIDKSDDMLSET